MADVTPYVATEVRIGDLVTHGKIVENAGTPEAVVAAPKGSICLDTTNGALYVKVSGTGNTGWTNLNGSLPAASQVGQVLFSTDGAAFDNFLPVTNDYGWMVNDSGILIVNG